MSAAADTIQEPREIARTREYGSNDSIRQTVSFDRPVTVEEFTAWLAAHHWLGYDRYAYGPAHITVDGPIGCYRHWRYSGD